MKSLIALPLVLALAGLCATEARAVGRLADVVVVDRETGEALHVHRHRGEWWIEGRPGARYAIRIRNGGSGRLLAVTSIDGVNVVTGETAAVDQRGYVYDAWNGYDITGWRKSDAQVAAFEFTTVPRSYAARTGRPDNVGVIGVALFRERSAPPLRAESDRAQLEKGTASARSAAPVPPAAQALGTGHGGRETSVVTRVEFERAQPQPDEVIRLRYDSRANLVAMGVLSSPAPHRPRRPDAFPSSPQLGYVPDP